MKSEDLFEKHEPFILDDTVIKGIMFTLKDGTKQYQPLITPIVYKTAEENNKDRNYNGKSDTDNRK